MVCVPLRIGARFDAARVGRVLHAHATASEGLTLFFTLINVSNTHTHLSAPLTVWWHEDVCGLCARWSLSHVQETARSPMRRQTVWILNYFFLDEWLLKYFYVGSWESCECSEVSSALYKSSVLSSPSCLPAWPLISRCSTHTHMRACSYIIARSLSWPVLRDLGAKTRWRVLAQLLGRSSKIPTAWISIWSVQDPFLSVCFSLGNRKK